MSNTEFKYMKPEEKREFVRDIISRKEAHRLLSEGKTLDDVPSACPEGTELVLRSDMEDLLCLENCNFPDTKLVALLDKAKDVGAIQGWEKVNFNEYDFSRDYKVLTVAGEVFIIEWWVNMMYLKIGNFKVEFHHIELGHKNCGSFGEWTFWFSRFQRPYLGRGHFCGSIQCESENQYLARTRRNNKEKTI